MKVNGVIRTQQQISIYFQTLPVDWPDVCGQGLFNIIVSASTQTFVVTIPAFQCLPLDLVQ